MPGYTHLTTAMVSNNGSNFVAATAPFFGTNISGTIASNGVSMSVAAAGGAQTAISGLSAGTTQMTSGTAVFSNSNGISFGVNGNTVTASYNSTQFQLTGNYLTTAMASNRGSNFMGTVTALTANGVSMTANSAGLSLNFPAFLTTAMQSASSSVFARTGFATTTTNGSVVVGTLNTNGMTLAVPPYLTTAQAPGAYLTTAMQSGSQSQLWVMGNSSGTIGGTNISGTVFSNGMSLSVAAAGGGGAAISGGANSQSTGTVNFANSNGITFGLSNNGTMTASHNGITQQSTQPVAVSGSNGSFNFSTLSFGNLNGLSFYTSNGSIVGSYTDAGAGAGISAVVISAGTTNSAISNFSFANSNGISFGLNGSTITATIPLNVTMNRYDNIPMGAATASAMTNTNVSFRYLLIPQDITFTRLDIPINISLVSTTTANTANIVFTSGAVLYTRNGSTLNPIVGQIANTTYTFASNTANYSSIIGGRYASFALATALTPGEYWLGLLFSTTNNSSIGTATTVLGNSISLVQGSYLTAQNFAEFGAVTSVSSVGGLFPMQGLCSVNLTNTTQTYQMSHITASGVAVMRANMMVRFRNN